MIVIEVDSTPTMHPPPAPCQIAQSNRTAPIQNSRSNRTAPTSIEQNLYESLSALSPIGKGDVAAPGQTSLSNHTAPNQTSQSNLTALSANSVDNVHNVDLEVLTFNYRELRLEGSISYYASLGECLSTGENLLAKDTNVTGDAWKRQQQRRRRQRSHHSPQSQRNHHRQGGEAVKGSKKGPVTTTAASLGSTSHHHKQTPSQHHTHLPQHTHARPHNLTHQSPSHHTTPPPLLRHPDPPLQLRQSIARVVNPAYLSSYKNHTNDHSPIIDSPETTRLPLSSSPTTFREEFHEKWSEKTHSMRSCPSWTHPLVIVMPVYKGRRTMRSTLSILPPPTPFCCFVIVVHCCCAIRCGSFYAFFCSVTNTISPYLVI